jgi:hypothetical protein
MIYILFVVSVIYSVRRIHYDFAVDSKTAVTLMHHLGALQTESWTVLITLRIGAQDRSVRSGLVEIRAFQAAVAGFPPEMLLARFHQDIHGEVAYIVWKAEGFVSGHGYLHHSHGKIVAQTFLMTM